LKIPTCLWCAVPISSFPSFAVLFRSVLCVCHSVATLDPGQCSTPTSVTQSDRCHTQACTALRSPNTTAGYFRHSPQSSSRMVGVYILLCCAVPLPPWCLPLGQEMRGQREQTPPGFSVGTISSLVNEKAPFLYSLGSSAATTAVTALGLHRSQERMEKKNRSTNPKQKTRAL
jgi:hypothetical protein